jgi:hypothetical protein
MQKIPTVRGRDFFVFQWLENRASIFPMPEKTTNARSA